MIIKRCMMQLEYISTRIIILQFFPNLNKKAVGLMAPLIKFYKFYYLLYLNKRWLNSQ